MRWVTFFYNELYDRVLCLKVHNDRDSALKCFNRECKNFFELNTQFKADRLPATYGHPWQKYYGISARSFKKMFNCTIDEAMEIAHAGSEEQV